MPYTPTGFVNQAQFAETVSRAIQKLGPEVVRVRYNVGSDTGGDPAIYFRIVLADWAVHKDTLYDDTEKIANVLTEEVRPYDCGLIPYFNFRSNSEQILREDPEWG